MGTAITRTLAAGYTTAQLQAAVLSLFDEAFGARANYNPDAARLWGFQNLEYPDFGGAKFVVRPSGASSFNFGIATSAVYGPVAGGTGATYRNLSQFGGTSLTATTGEARLFVVKGVSYYLFGFFLGTNTTTMFGLGELRAVPAFWGTRRKAYGISGGTTGVLMPGENPWGTINPSTGQATVVGITGISLEGTRPNQQNTLLAKRQITLSGPVYANEANIGFQSADIGYVAYAGINNAALAMLDAGSDGLYFMLPTINNGMCVKVASAPFPGLPTHPAYIFDLGSAKEAGGETVIEPHPSRLVLSGQIWPSPHGLDIVGQP